MCSLLSIAITRLENLCMYDIIGELYNQQMVHVTYMHAHIPPIKPPPFATQHSFIKALNKKILPKRLSEVGLFNLFQCSFIHFQQCIPLPFRFSFIKVA